ncbi:MAG: UPF0179 family protein [Candidatus Geothermarchaeales archaeon]
MVTFVGEPCAKKGHVFQFFKSDACNECKHRTPCIGRLEQGRIYEIVDIRGESKTLRCPLTDNYVRVVEVIPAKIRAAIPVKGAIEGAKTKFFRLSCSEDCEGKVLCDPVGLCEGDAVRIEEVRDPILCPLGHRLVEAVLSLVLT